ncbi:pseudouridine synthase [Vicingaceae bacterium]|nr:pseudouridine synthase [Vicingaceae bacterium]MDB4060404.1 pseudouridine synthase [Vicingaceae bacterium]
MHSHYLIHKPYGYLSQFVNNGPKQGKKKLLGDLHDFPEGTMAIGRLDEPSEGLLLLTTDGMMSEMVRGKNVEKEYFTQVDGLVDDEAIRLMERGIEIGFHGKKYTTKPCTVISIDDPNFPNRTQKIRDPKHGPTSWISITLKEGKFRQVRKMTAAVGLPTLRLVRVRIGNYKMEGFNSGEVIVLEKIEV